MKKKKTVRTPDPARGPSRKAAEPERGRPRVIVVAKRSSFARLESGDTDQRARALVRDGHDTVRKWLPAHEDHVATLERVEHALSRLGAEVLVLHGSHAEFDARRADLVVTVGGDGTLLAASHCVSSVPILGVNSAPRYSVGFFCGAQGAQVERRLAQALSGELDEVTLTRMAVSINGHVRSERVLNEALFCHAEPAATSNYILELGRRREEQRSSGFWIGTAAGSTGAVRSAGGRVLPLGSAKLQLVVREPYVGDGRSYRILREVIDQSTIVRAHSKMHQARVFLDGPYRALTVRLGDEVRFEPSSQPLRVLGLKRKRRA